MTLGEASENSRMPNLRSINVLRYLMQCGWNWITAHLHSKP